MINNRETIYAALFALVGSSSAFVTKSRRYKPFTEVPPLEQPAIFQVQGPERPHQVTGLPAGWKFDVDLVIYVNSTGQMDTVASSLLNPILDAVCNLFDTANQPAANKQTLGGLVHYARIAERGIETDEGVLGDQTFAIIPIEIFAY